MTDYRYPIGKSPKPAAMHADELARSIEEIASAPAAMRRAVEGLDTHQLDTPYRDGGWTVRQVVHHVPDSHMNAYMRFKLALTEKDPLIRTYQENLWAELGEARQAPIEVSLRLLESLHERWVASLRSMGAEDFERQFQHPEWGAVALFQSVAIYSWHGRHHTAHITSLRERNGW